MGTTTTIRCLKHAEVFTAEEKSTHRHSSSHVLWRVTSWSLTALQPYMQSILAWDQCPCQATHLGRFREDRLSGPAGPVRASEMGTARGDWLLTRKRVVRSGMPPCGRLSVCQYLQYDHEFNAGPHPGNWPLFHADKNSPRKDQTGRRDLYWPWKRHVNFSKCAPIGFMGDDYRF